MKVGGLLRVRPNGGGNWAAAGGVKDGKELTWGIESFFDIWIGLRFWGW